MDNVRAGGIYREEFDISMCPQEDPMMCCHDRSMCPQGEISQLTFPRSVVRVLDATSHLPNYITFLQSRRYIQSRHGIRESTLFCLPQGSRRDAMELLKEGYSGGI